jgi:hypothetical protein
MGKRPFLANLFRLATVEICSVAIDPNVRTTTFRKEIVRRKRKSPIRIRTPQVPHAGMAIHSSRRIAAPVEMTGTFGDTQIKISLWSK